MWDYVFLYMCAYLPVVIVIGGGVACVYYFKYVEDVDLYPPYTNHNLIYL